MQKKIPNLYRPGFREVKSQNHFTDFQSRSFPELAALKTAKLLGLLCILFCSVCASRAAHRDVLDLSGQWRFALDREDKGIAEKYFDRDLTDKIQLPGILQSQGYGDDIAFYTPWVLGLYDKSWFLREDYKNYTNAGYVKVPFICQPPKHYLGAAWYQTDFEIPQDWKSRREVLFLERPHWESRVWLDGALIGTNKLVWGDGALIGTNNSLCAPHQFELGTGLAPGKHRLTIRVDNRMILPYRPDAHSVSDSLGQSWNGIVGKIEVRSSDPVCIKEMQIYPDIEKHSAKVTLHLFNSSGTNVPAASLKLQAVPKNFSGNSAPQLESTVAIAPGESSIDVQLDMGANFQAWSEFKPMLYELDASLSGDGFQSSFAETFGMREFKADGRKFTLNGREVYFRGTHNGGDFPLTGYPPTDVDWWRKMFVTCKQWGLNHMRFHSFCPPEAAFVAADELGFYLQIECGMWNEFRPGGEMEAMLYLETGRIISAYGNHPSFVLLSASNEAHGNWKPCLTKWVEHYRTADPRRLYTPDTGWAAVDAPGPVKGADYIAVGRLGQGPVRGDSGWFGSNYSASLEGVNVPVLAHELGQWCAYPDYDIIKKFTGYLQPGNYKIFRDSLAAHGMEGKDHAFAAASGRWQLQCYKEEIEANLRTTGTAGFQLLDLHDYIGQGTALVGLLDTFWESKGYAGPEDFRKFCGDTVPLARLKSRVFSSTDPFEVDCEIAHYGAEPIVNAQPRWKVVDASGGVAAQGEFPARDIPIGKGIPLGHVTGDLSKLKAPGVYKLVVSFDKPDVANEWNFWVYPAKLNDAEPHNVFIAHSPDEAAEKLAAGGRVLLLPRNSDLDWTSPPLDNVPIFWNRLMGPKWGRMLGLTCDEKHPALAEFPTESFGDWQWISLLRNVRAVNLETLPRELQPIVQAIDDWNRNYKLGVIFECKSGAGRLLVCSIDIESKLDSRPAAAQLRRSLLDYMGGSDFNPGVNVSASQLAGLFFDSRIMAHLGAKAVVSNQPADALIDGDPNTFWLGVAAKKSGAYASREIRISFPQPVAMNGFVVMPRQNDRDHIGDIREYKLEAGTDATNWQTVSQGTLLSSFSPQAVRFKETVAAKELKLTALSGYGTDTSAALAEFAILYAGPKLTNADGTVIEYRRVRTSSADIDEAGDSTNAAPASRKK